jgi:predicted GIY-YIG superfamily endonuclease
MPQSAAVDRTSHVYLMASKSGVLYVDVTSNLANESPNTKANKSSASRKNTT